MRPAPRRRPGTRPPFVILAANLVVFTPGAGPLVRLVAASIVAANFRAFHPDLSLPVMTAVILFGSSFVLSLPGRIAAAWPIMVRNAADIVPEAGGCWAVLARIVLWIDYILTPFKENTNDDDVRRSARLQDFEARMQTATTQRY